MRPTILILGAALLSSCDPAGRAARVRPDKSVEVVAYEGVKTLADVYLSKDTMVELQVYGSANTGAPAIRAFIVNNRKQPITIDFVNATFEAPYSHQRQHLRYIHYEGCRASKELEPHFCMPNEITIESSGELKVILFDAASGEFRLPIRSPDKQIDEIVATFKRCGVFEKCETIR